VAFHHRRDRSKQDHDAEERNFLLGRDSSFEHAGHRAWDFTATTTGLGFERGALVFAGLIAIVAAAHYFTKLPDSVLFWAAYVLTRPLGATLGDLVTKPRADGGLNLGRIASLLTIAAVMIALVALTSRRKSIEPSEK
jgi:uncharacterized membrane-anchored protein